MGQLIGHAQNDVVFSGRVLQHEITLRVRVVVVGLIDVAELHNQQVINLIADTTVQPVALEYRAPRVEKQLIVGRD